MPVTYEAAAAAQATGDARRSRQSATGVMELQRARMIASTAATVEAGGLRALTVAQVIKGARVSRTTFYAIFLDTEDCFLAAFEHTLARARAVASQAYAAHEGWREGMRAAVRALLIEMKHERGLARMCVVEALGGGERVLARRTQTLDDVARVIALGAREPGVLEDAQPFTAAAIAGGIAELLHNRLVHDDPAPLTDLLGPAMSMIVMPYLGLAAAAQELRALEVKGVQDDARPPVAKVSNPLAGLNMRLTYRTVRVLVAIADRPGASNREISEHADVIDQGQISKLLRRLAALGLVENVGAGQTRGGPNAWHLTALGAEVHRAARGC